MKKLEKLARKAAEEASEDDEDEIEKEAKESGSDEEDGPSAKVPFKISKIKIDSSGLSEKNLKFLEKPSTITKFKKPINQNKGKKFLPYFDNEVIGEYAVKEYLKFNPKAYIFPQVSSRSSSR